MGVFLMLMKLGMDLQHRVSDPLRELLAGEISKQ
jgi:hypothetical protein